MSSTTDRELVTTRLVNAPQAQVWKAFTDHSQVNLWWGPNDFHNSDSEMDFRVGGVWRFKMNGPGGMVFSEKIQYTEITPMTRIAFDHGDEERVHFQSLITFEARGKQTFVSMIAIFPTKEIRDETVKNVHAIEGGKQTLNKLEEFVKTESTVTDREIKSSRVFAATPAQVFAAWTDPERLKLWWGPSGFSNRFETFEFKPGGKWVFTMVGPDAKEYPNSSQFIEIVPGERIVFEHVNAPRFRMTVILSPEDGGCRMSWTMLFEAPEVLDAVKGFAVEGNRQNFARLAAHLEKR